MVKVKTKKGDKSALKFKKDRNTIPQHNDSMLACYLKGIDKVKLLTRKEEESLAKKLFYGDSEARAKLIEANLRFVVNIAKKYQKRGLTLIDLINEGNLGLVYAADKFDYRKGYHFISYAIWWIRQSILKALSEKTRLIRLPLNRANQLLKIERLKKTIAQQNDIENLSVTKIAEALHFKIKDVVNIINASKDYISIDTPICNSDGNERKLYETIEDDNYKSPETYIIEESLKKAIAQSLSTLPKKERDIISYRYGLNGKNTKSLKEIGKEFELTKERIRQIEKRAIQRLRHPSRSILLRAFIIN